MFAAERKKKLDGNKRLTTPFNALSVAVPFPDRFGAFFARERNQPCMNCFST